MNYQRLATRTEKHEGFEPRPYKDSEGYWTIGIGCRRWRGKAVDASTPAVTIEEAREEMRKNLFGACVDAQNYFPNLTYLTSLRQEILAEMAYQLGYEGLCKFKKLKEALNAKNWQLAKLEMLSSLWAQQTPQRAEELAELMAMEL